MSNLILSPPVKYFSDRSKAVLLLWIIYVISVLFWYAIVRVCLLMPCGHLLGKGWPLDSRLWCLIVKLSLSHWYLGSGVVLDCIDSWSLLSFLLGNFKCDYHSIFKGVSLGSIRGPVLFNIFINGIFHYIKTVSCIIMLMITQFCMLTKIWKGSLMNLLRIAWDLFSGYESKLL